MLSSLMVTEIKRNLPEYQQTASIRNPPAWHRGLPGPSGPGAQKGPKRVRNGVPRPPAQGAPESPKSAPRSPKRVQKEAEAAFLDSFRTPGRTLWGLWGSPGPEAPGHPFGLFWAPGPEGPGSPLCQAGGFLRLAKN